MTDLLLYLDNGDPYEQEAAATIRRLTRERDEARATLEWQPIETAPKDGRRILTWGCLHNDGLECGEDPGCEVSWWREGAWFNAILGAHEPTHWRPLPPPPEGKP